MKSQVMQLLNRLSSAQTDESELAPHPHRIRLWGSGPEDLKFPPLCPNCGAAATTRVAYSKVFHSVRHSEDGRRQGYVTTVVKVPYCDACIARHRTEATQRRTLVGLLMHLRAALQGIWTVAFAGGAIAAGYGAIVLLPRALPIAVSLLLLSLLLAGAAFGGYRLAREGREYMRATPQNGITTAFDFGESTRPNGESDRFLCTIRNERFAQEFAKLNSGRLYVPDSRTAA